MSTVNPPLKELLEVYPAHVLCELLEDYLKEDFERLDYDGFSFIYHVLQSLIDEILLQSQSPEDEQ